MMNKEQEPVARIGFLPEVGGGKYFERLAAWKDLPVGASLYTTPPQRKPLTDEQRLAIQEKQKFPPMCDPYIYWFFKGVDACEAAHGIKE